jgi:nicotinamidase-related amidase
VQQYSWPNNEPQTSLQQSITPNTVSQETQKWNNTWPKLSLRNSPHHQLAKNLLKKLSLLSVKSKISIGIVNDTGQRLKQMFFTIKI